MISIPPTLPPEALRRTCDAGAFDFETTAELPALNEVLGQPRAVAALEFGTRIVGHEFNLFAMGLPGSGKTTLIREYLERRAVGQPVPPDLCYVANFADPRRPVAVKLPAGRAPQFKRDMADLVRELKAAIPRAFESKDYEDQRDRILEDLEAKRHEEFTRLDAHVTQWGFQLVKGPGTLLLVPAMDGKPISERDFEKLTPEQREKLIKVRERLEEDLENSLRRVRDMEKTARDTLRALDTETARSAVRRPVDDLRAGYAGLDGVLAYLDALHADVVERAEEFRKDREAEKPALPVPLPTPPVDPFARYAVNVVVDNSGLAGAPVVVESNPTYHKLIGRIEHQATWSGVVTDFTMVKAGSLLSANGGYLILPARECLLNAFAWEGLKRALKDRVVRIEEPGTQMSLFSTVSLEPEPVPLDVKVVLIGSPMIYYLLYAYDEDFQKLFQVKADFTSQMDRTREAERAYAQFVGTIARQEASLPFDRGAVARVVEFGSRLADDQEKLSTRFGEIADLVREAAHRASQNSHSAVMAQDVESAVEARRYRQNLIEANLQEAIARGTLLIETSGQAIGQVNGLSVVGLGDYVFGHPVRITAAAAPGRRGVVSIEREVDLSGPIHGKGVLILGGYLNQKYGQCGPLSLSASLVFEQSYGMVEGDSASLAELYALLSTLSGIPLRQDVAVTGSINQRGLVQPVGSISEKVEGFFDVCRSRGLTGRQGVLIPSANRQHLMLREEVVAAVRDGQFHIWVAEDVDDGLPLLAGVPAGRPEEEGAYAGEYLIGTLHRAVLDRLAEFAERLRQSGNGQERAAELGSPG